MNAPLLTTKLYIPPVRPGLVPRPRLIQRLNDGLNGKLTLISAPAGFGKTTLLSEWIRHCVEEQPVPPAPQLRHTDEGRKTRDEFTKQPIPPAPQLPCPPAQIAWLSLDDEDNDPIRFLNYVIAALETVHKGVGADARALLQSPKPPPLKSILTLLINSLATSPGAPLTDSGHVPSTQPGHWIVLVLDDYHVIEEDSIHEAIAFLLDHMPPHMHLVIASRVDPPLPLARLRTRSQLIELREADLRFTQDEALAFLNRAMEIGLSLEDAVALEARTEGWAAGLQLAALSMQGRDIERIPEFIAAFSGSHRHVIDYLAEEVMAQQPEKIHDFLCQTAILDRLTAPLCDAVTGREDSDALLRQLDVTQLFLVPLDDQREWYRYHHLFADFLRSHLRQDMPDRITDLHLRAAEWYQHHGLITEAVGHALNAADFERAADLIEEIIEATMMRSEITTLQKWVEALPDDIVRSRPRICVYQAWALLLTGHPLETAEARLQDATEADAAGSVAGEVALFRALIATYQGETRQSAELAQEALRLLPKDNLFLRSLVAGLLGVSYLWSGDIVTAKQTLDQAARMSQKAGNLMNAVLALGHLAEVAMIEGQLFEAQSLYNKAIKLGVDDQGQPRPIAGVPLIGLGALLRERNDLEAAERHITEGIELAKRWGEVGSISGYGNLARVKQAQGDVEGAYQAIQKAGQLAKNFDAMEVDDRHVDVYQVRLWIDQGNFGAATHWAEERGLSLDVGLNQMAKQQASGASVPLIRVIEYAMLAQVYIAQDRPDEALHVLASILQITETAEWTALVIHSLVLQALALQARGDTSLAVEALARALSLAKPGGFVRVFVDEGEPMATLLRQVASRGIEPSYVGELLSAFGAEMQEGREAEGRSPQHPGTSAPLLIEPLSERELEVLRLIAAGLSNREIADRLIIAISTVKTHVNNIYRKLDVSKRTQAVARASELNML